MVFAARLRQAVSGLSRAAGLTRVSTVHIIVVIVALNGRTTLGSVLLFGSALVSNSACSEEYSCCGVAAFGLLPALDCLIESGRSYGTFDLLFFAYDRL